MFFLDLHFFLIFLEYPHLWNPFAINSGWEAQTCETNYQFLVPQGGDPDRGGEGGGGGWGGQQWCGARSRATSQMGSAFPDLVDWMLFSFGFVFESLLVWSFCSQHSYPAPRFARRGGVPRTPPTAREPKFECVGFEPVCFFNGFTCWIALEVPPHRFKLFGVGFARATYLGAPFADEVPDSAMEPPYDFEAWLVKGSVHYIQCVH